MAKPKKVYLVAKYFARPKNRKMTSVKGYMKDPDNIAWDEQVGITLGIKERDMNTAKIVLNITDQKIERNGFQTDKSFMELFEYFYNASPKELGQQLRSVGISVAEKTDGNQGNVPENQTTDVLGEAEASTGPEPTAAAEPAVA